MNIKLVSDFDLDNFEDFLPGTTLLDIDKDFNDDIDLLIFPGGEDVSPQYYLNADEQRDQGNFCHSNKNRDIYESNVLDLAINNPKVNKILGICRGVQFLNVMFGGTLFTDLGYYGLAHEPIHQLNHVNKSNLSFIKTVNSLHHQGLRNLGEIHRNSDIYVMAKKIAIDSDRGYVTEIISWMNERILGFQFHPEYYREYSSDKDKIRQFIYDWIKGTQTIF